LDWYEANASTDLMGFATVTVGRMALDYGSGLILGSNDWGTRPNTYDGGVFNINTDIVDVDLGYYTNNNGGPSDENQTSMLINVAKSDGDWTINGLYIAQDDGMGGEMNWMGVDAGYSMMSGALDLSVSYNTGTAKATGFDDYDVDMMILGLAYNINDDLSISATRTTCGENDFNSTAGNYGIGTSSWRSHGNMGYLTANDQALSFGMSYSMGDFSIGATMHKVTNEEDVWVDAVTGAESDYDRSVVELNLGYTMSDHANVSIKYATDEGSWDQVYGAEETKYMWLTLNITP
jgi:hypothetical protein